MLRKIISFFNKLDKLFDSLPEKINGFQKNQFINTHPLVAKLTIVLFGMCGVLLFLFPTPVTKILGIVCILLSVVSLYLLGKNVRNFNRQKKKNKRNENTINEKEVIMVKDNDQEKLHIGFFILFFILIILTLFFSEFFRQKILIFFNLFSITTILILLFIILGVCLILKWRRTTEETERIILNFIASKEGKVTPIEIASKTTLTLKEAKKTLDKLIDNGMGTQHITPHGKLIYVFEEFVTSEEKKEAKDVMEFDEPYENN